MVFEVVDEGLILRKNTVMVNVVAISIGIFKRIRTVQRVNSKTGRIPRAEAFGFPSIGQSVAVRINQIGVSNRPVLGCFGGLTVILEQVPVDTHKADNGPLVFAEVWQPIAISIPVCIVCTKGIKTPIISSSERVTNPTSMLYFPSIRHAITVCIWIGWVGGSVDVGE